MLCSRAHPKPVSKLPKLVLPGVVFILCCPDRLEEPHAQRGAGGEVRTGMGEPGSPCAATAVPSGFSSSPQTQAHRGGSERGETGKGRSELHVTQTNIAAEDDTSLAEAHVTFAARHAGRLLHEIPGSSAALAPSQQRNWSRARWRRPAQLWLSFENLRALHKH